MTQAIAAETPTAPAPKRGKAKKEPRGQVAEGERRRSGVPQKARTRRMYAAYWVAVDDKGRGVNEPWGGSEREWCPTIRKLTLGTPSFPPFSH